MRERNSPETGSRLPRVTVGILCHDARRYLRETLESVTNQTYPNLEILALDNASTDGSGDLLKQRADVTTVYEGRNIGYGEAKNLLVHRASGEYVLLLDDDVKLPDPGTITKCVRFARRLRDRCLLSIVLDESDAALTPHYGLFFAASKRTVMLEQLRALPPFRVAGPVGGCLFVRRSVFEELGGFDEMYPINLDDYDLGARAYLQGLEVWMVTTTYGVHQGRARRNDSRAWEWRQSYYLCGMIRTLAKSCRLRNAAVWIPAATMWILARAVAQTPTRGLVPVTRTILKSVFRVARDAPSTLRERVHVQARRTVDGDRFLTLIPPAHCQNRVARVIVGLTGRFAGLRVG